MNRVNLLIKRAIIGFFVIVFGLIYVIKINPVYLNTENDENITFETFTINETKNFENSLVESSIENLEDNTKSPKSEDITNIDKKRININTCSKEELILLPGIGEKTAENIVKYREENGGFKNISHIKNVKRIGEKTFEKIKNMISVD